MAEVLALVVVTLFLAYANGANDNFKGVATLFGSRTTNYSRALWWATGTTLLGSCAAVLLPGGLVRAFSGKGLVPETLTNEPDFLLAVGLGAALTVMLATLTGWPIFDHPRPDRSPGGCRPDGRWFGRSYPTGYELLPASWAEPFAESGAGGKYLPCSADRSAVDGCGTADVPMCRGGRATAPKIVALSRRWSTGCLRDEESTAR